MSCYLNAEVLKVNIFEKPLHIHASIISTQETMLCHPYSLVLYPILSRKYNISNPISVIVCSNSKSNFIIHRAIYW